MTTLIISNIHTGKVDRKAFAFHSKACKWVCKWEKKLLLFGKTSWRDYRVEIHVKENVG